jgi:hypothetical protein
VGHLIYLKIHTRVLCKHKHQSSKEKYNKNQCILFLEKMLVGGGGGGGLAPDNKVSCDFM